MSPIVPKELLPALLRAVPRDYRLPQVFAVSVHSASSGLLGFGIESRAGKIITLSSALVSAPA